MTPEEKFNQDVWWVLQEIKEESLATLKDKPLKFEVVKLVAAGIPSQDRQKNIIHKLQELKAIKITYETDPSGGGISRYLFELKILQPKFDEVYKKYQKACDLQSHLNDYQQKVFEGKKKLPEFGKMDEPVFRKAIFATPAYSIKSRQIADQFSPENYDFILMVLKQIVSQADFSIDGKIIYQLQSPAGQAKVNERSLLQKLETQGLLRNLGEDGIFGIFTLDNVDILLIKELIALIGERQSGVMSEEEFEEIKKQKVQPSKLQQKYDSLIDALNPKKVNTDLQDRYQKIIGEIKNQENSLPISNVDMTAEEKILFILRKIKDAKNLAPKDKLCQIAARDLDRVMSRQDHEQIFEKLEQEYKILEVHTKPNYIYEFHYRFYVLDDFDKIFKTYAMSTVTRQQEKRSDLEHDGDKTTETQKQSKSSFPSGWELIEEDKNPQIKKDGSVVFTFPNNWSGKYKYFKCLWKNYGVKKSYKEVYEFESKLKYPEKGVWRINRNMRTTINKFRKELEDKNLPIDIETNKGFILTIS